MIINLPRRNQWVPVVLTRAMYFISDQIEETTDAPICTTDAPESTSSSSLESSLPDTCSPDAPSFSPLTTLTTSSSDADSIFRLLGLTAEEPSTPAVPTFKIVGDNIDKHVKPREMRIDAQATSLHYFNIYAVQDRLDMTSLPDDAAMPDLSSVRFEDVLPDHDDDIALKTNFAVLVGRVLKKHMPFFATYGSGLESHIKHVYYKEMAQKSKVVSCCAIVAQCVGESKAQVLLKRFAGWLSSAISKWSRQ